VQGWVSLAAPPENGQTLSVAFTFSRDLDLITSTPSTWIFDNLTCDGELPADPPSITGATHVPAEPVPSDTVFVTANVTDCSGLDVVELYVDTGAGYVSMPMFDDGDHHDVDLNDSEYGAAIPPVSNGTEVYYYLHARDVSGGLSYDPPDAPVAAYGYTSGCCGQYTGGFAGNANCSEDGSLTLSDITKLIDRVYISKEELCCEENGNVNGDPEGLMTLSDIARLIDRVFVSKGPTEPCL
jgi:hypothetical protein